MLVEKRRVDATAAPANNRPDDERDGKHDEREENDARGSAAGHRESDSESIVVAARFPLAAAWCASTRIRRRGGIFFDGAQIKCRDATLRVVP